MSCQTNVDTPRLSSCTCADVVFDIEELKLGQEINRETIQALSQSVEQIVEAMGQCKGEKSAEKGEKLVKNGKGKPATDMHRLTHAQTKEINEANNPNASDISIIEICHQNNLGAANPNNAGTDNVSASEIVGRSETSAPNQDRLPQHTKTPKSYVPCPFLRRKGYCLKGSKCDFSHSNPQQLFQPYRQQYFPPPFYGQTPYTIFKVPKRHETPTFLSPCKLPLYASPDGHSNKTTQALLNEIVDLPNNCILPCKPLTTELYQPNTTTLKQRI